LEYQVARSHRACTKCSRELGPGDELVSELHEGADEEGKPAFLREDFCPGCWEGPREGSVGHWHTRVSAADAPKKRFVDDDILRNFFERLEGSDDEMRVNFRYILALVLMRKRILKFHDTRDEGGRSVLVLRYAGSEETTEVVDPGLDESKISEVSREVGDILSAEL
jgi:hypothetical protein